MITITGGKKGTVSAVISSSLKRLRGKDDYGLHCHIDVYKPLEEVDATIPSHVE